MAGLGTGLMPCCVAQAPACQTGHYSLPADLEAILFELAASPLKSKLGQFGDTAS